MYEKEALGLASLVVLLDHIAELGRLANAAPDVVADGGAAGRKCADGAVSISDYSTKNNHHNQRVNAKGNTTEVE